MKQALAIIFMPVNVFASDLVQGLMDKWFVGRGRMSLLRKADETVAAFALVYRKHWRGEEDGEETNGAEKVTPGCSNRTLSLQEDRWSKFFCRFVVLVFSRKPPEYLGFRRFFRKPRFGTRKPEPPV